jgi:Uma2 family endonuclease
MVQPARVDPPPTSEYRFKMSYEEFLEWCDEDTHAEWVNGEVIVFMPPYIVHQDIIGFLHALLAHYVQFFDLGKLLIAPFEMLLLPGHVVREPDIAFITHNHLHRVKEKRLEGAADLVVEVISKESVTRDRREKYHEYAQAGVQEYWIIDPRPRQRKASFYQRTPQGEYTPLLPDDDGRIHSLVLDGFWLRQDWLWQEPYPRLDDVLHQIIGDAYEQEMNKRRLAAGGEAYAQQLIELLLDENNADYNRRILESLRKRGIVPSSPDDTSDE